MKLPSEMTYWERVRFTILCLIALLSLLGFIHVTETRAHPDGTTPYWYPSTYLYGFVQGCWETVEQNQSLAEGMWPDDIRAVCGCVIDSVRHSIPFHEAEGKTPESIKKFDYITSNVLPQCIMEVEAGIIMRNGEK